MKANESLNLAISKLSVLSWLVPADAHRDSLSASYHKVEPVPTFWHRKPLNMSTTPTLSTHFTLPSLATPNSYKHTELLLESNIFILLLSPIMFSFHYKPSKPKSLVFLFGFNGNFYYSVHNILQITVQV